jgi:hypothetical protein
MFNKKSKVNLKPLQSIMRGKQLTKKKERLDYIENLYNITTTKLNKTQKVIDTKLKNQKKFQKTSQKNILY